MISKETKYTVSCSRCLKDFEVFITDHNPPLPEVYQNVNIRDENAMGNIYLNFQYKRDNKYTTEAKSSTICTKCKFVMARMVMNSLRLELREKVK